MAKNFNGGVSALSELGRSKLDEVETALDAARAWLTVQVEEARRSIHELCPPAKRQRLGRGANKPTLHDPADKVCIPCRYTLGHSMDSITVVD